MVKEGSFADGLPPRSRTEGDYDWDGLARRAQRRPGKPMLAAENVRYSLIKSVMQYRRDPFQSEDGRIVVNMRNSRVEDGVRYGSVWFTFVPHQEVEA